MDSGFEKRLRRLPAKPIPQAWRAEILASARQQSIRHSPFVIRHSRLTGFMQQLSDALQPQRHAWAGLAAVWVVIFLLNFSTHEPSSVMARTSVPASPEVMVELQQQKKMFTELVGAAELRVANRQPIWLPKPRSERAEVLAA